MHQVSWLPGNLKAWIHPVIPFVMLFINLPKTADDLKRNQSRVKKLSLNRFHCSISLLVWLQWCYLHTSLRISTPMPTRSVHLLLQSALLLPYFGGWTHSVQHTMTSSHPFHSLQSRWSLQLCNTESRNGNLGDS